jgi:hypothetical protein
MAFSSFLNAFSRVGPQNDNAPTIWTYKTTDALTATDAAGYFNAVADRVKVGDWILVSSSSTYGIQIVEPEHARSDGCAACHGRGRRSERTCCRHDRLRLRSFPAFRLCVETASGQASPPNQHLRRSRWTR